MPFVPHTESDVAEMLKAIGARRIDDLFDEIPESLRIGELAGVPPGLGEMEISRLMRERAARDGVPLCFAGAGAYDHHIPAAVWAIACWMRSNCWTRSRAGSAASRCAAGWMI